MLAYYSSCVQEYCSGVWQSGLARTVAITVDRRTPAAACMLNSLWKSVGITFRFYEIGVLEKIALTTIRKSVTSVT